MIQLFSNNAVSLLAAPLSATATSLQVMAGHGARYPAPTGGDFFLVTLEDEAATTREIIRVTGRSGDVLTFSLADRGQEGTTARAWPAGGGADTLVDHRVTAETLRRLQTAASGSLYDQPWALGGGPTPTVSLPSPFAPGSVRLFVGGLRQKLGADFTETGPAEVTLTFPLTLAEVAQGQAIVVDYDPA